MSPNLPRRTLCAALAAAASLSACGFALRREPVLQFHSIAFNGFKPDSPLASELKRNLARTLVQWQADANKAEVVLEVQRESRERTVVASTVAGQVREWQLRLRLEYLLRTPSGELLLPRTELELSREMNYTETNALAKDQEEGLLFRAMQSDAVAQVMRRLAAVRLPS